jgi:dTDP-4-amino-4,6-dideoxygalactose transaminase
VSDNGRIPFLDLVTPHQELEQELVAVFRRALHTAGFVGGQIVEEFETEFAEFCGTRYCVGVGSGTDALRFALIAAGVKLGDTVITAPNTFIATTEAISQAGARPDFVDVDERTYTMDAEKLHEYLEKRCRWNPSTGQLLNERTGSRISGVVPVHLYGQMADMDAILELAEHYNLFVIEDACQAHGASYYSRKEGCWKKAGSMGVAAAFSFYPGKNLGACGEAGAVTTNDASLAAKIHMLRDHGQVQKYHHDIEGYNGRLDAIQAGILRAKLKRLPGWNQERCAHARVYNQLFRSQIAAMVLPYESPWTKPVYHLYVIRVKNRDRLQACLAEANIGTQIHYPTPLHLEKAYASLSCKTGDFPIAEKAASEILSLPMYPQLKPSQQAKIAQAVCNFLDEEHAGSGMRRPHSAATHEGSVA